MTLGAAHLCALLLALTDIGARGWRYALLLRGLRAQLTIRSALVLTVFGDAVAAITPLRLGGEPARILGAKHDGVPVNRAIVALALENVVTYLILIPSAAIMAGRYGKDWWLTVASHIQLGLLRWFVVAMLVLLAAWTAFVLWRRGRRPDAGGRTREGQGWRRLVSDLLSFPVPLLHQCAGLSAVSLVARVAILPVLVLATRNPPSLGVATVASLGLLYGQLVVPTPSGAGPIDVAVLAGGTGVGAKAAAVLSAWRLYTTIVPIVLGLIAGSLAYGRAVLSLLPGRRLR